MCILFYFVVFCVPYSIWLEIGPMIIITHGLTSQSSHRYKHTHTSQKNSIKLKLSLSLSHTVSLSHIIIVGSLRTHRDRQHRMINIINIIACSQWMCERVRCERLWLLWAIDWGVGNFSAEWKFPMELTMCNRIKNCSIRHGRQRPQQQQQSRFNSDTGETGLFVCPMLYLFRKITNNRNWNKLFISIVNHNKSIEHCFDIGKKATTNKTKQTNNSCCCCCFTFHLIVYLSLWLWPLIWLLQSQYRNRIAGPAHLAISSDAHLWTCFWSHNWHYRCRHISFSTARARTLCFSFFFSKFTMLFCFRHLFNLFWKLSMCFVFVLFCAIF